MEVMVTGMSICSGHLFLGCVYPTAVISGVCSAAELQSKLKRELLVDD